MDAFLYSAVNGVKHSDSGGGIGFIFGPEVVTLKFCLIPVLLDLLIPLLVLQQCVLLHLGL